VELMTRGSFTMRDGSYYITYRETKTPAATRTRADSSAFAIIVSFPTGEDGHRCVSGPTDPSSHRHGVHGLQKNGQVQEQAPSVDVVHVEVELVLPIEFVPTADLRQP